MSNKKLPKNLSDVTEKIKFTREGVNNPQNIDYSGSFASMNIDNSKSLNDFKNMKINILNMNDLDMTFEIIGIDAPIANALRRIMIAEIPTMAIEKVNLYQNTSIIHDEVLCHRIGLVPIKVDPTKFIFKKENEDDHENNCLKFKLHAKCERYPEYKKADKKTIDSLPVDKVYKNTIVYSGALEWIPIGKQAEIFKDNPPRPVFDSIIIAKLRENQEIEAELKCEKGRGRIHAKWSPVATAFYRTMPHIELKKEILNDQAEELVKICPVDVYDIEDLGKQKRGIVARPYNCTMCRECIRPDYFNEAISLEKIRDHFIFTIESVGILKPIEIFKQSLQILKEKCLFHSEFFEMSKDKAK